MASASVDMTTCGLTASLAAVVLVGTMKLLERAPQIAELRDALVQAGQGHGRTVLLSGEAGVGKTSLLREFTEAVAARVRVFEGSCDELRTPRTLGPFRDMARDYGGGLGNAGIDDRDAFIEALVSEMSFAQRPAVVIVEDAHWADHASLDIVRLLARRVPDLPALLVISYRDDELSDEHPMRRVVGAMTGPAVLRLRLHGLSDGAVGELAVAAGLDPSQVIAAVGGNPFYLSEVLAEPGAVVPASVRDAVLARVASLPLECRAALEQIAVVPSEIESWLARAVLDDPAVLDHAERRGIVTFAHRGLRFRHDIARRVIEMSMSSSRRADGHRRVLRALVAAGAESSRLVHHALGAGDDAALATYAMAAAADAAAANSHSEAVVFARLALRHGNHLGGVESARLHGYAAVALHALNRFSEAVDHADRAVSAWDAAGSAPAALGEALLISARLSIVLGRPTQARAKAVRAVEILRPTGPSRALAFAYSSVAGQETMLGRFAEAGPWCDLAVAVARETDSQDVLAYALCFRGHSRMSLGDESGEADAREAIAIASRIDHGDYLTVAAYNLAIALIRSGRVPEAKDCLDIAEQASREHRLEQARYRTEAQQCQVLILQGSWDAAERRLRNLVDSAADAGANAVNPLAFLGRILARRGDPAAGELIQRAWDLAAASGQDEKTAAAAGARVEWLWLTGDLAGVRTVGAEALEFAIAMHHSYLRAEILRYLRRAGVPVEPFPACLPSYAAGIRGDWTAAAGLWEEAGNPYEHALELSESPDVAVAVRALGILDRLGATATSAIVRRRMRRDGVRSIPRGPRSATRRNPGSLTDRQLEILALVDQGCTNSEIADRLFLSRRTVDNHVSALLRRLGVGSRTAALAAATSAGLLHREH